MKLTTLKTLAFAVLMMGVTSVASADFEIIRIVGNLFDTTEKTTFDLSEVPYLYVKLTHPGTAIVNSFWNHAGDAPQFEFNFSSDQERWLTLANWNTVKETGLWTVNANYFFGNGESGTGVAQFTVTPEPISTALFLAGGLPFAAALYRRRKNTLKV